MPTRIRRLGSELDDPRPQPRSRRRPRALEHRPRAGGARPRHPCGEHLGRDQARGRPRLRRARRAGTNRSHRGARPAAGPTARPPEPRAAPALGGSYDDVDHDLLALAWEQIRTYRIDRRPAAIAANILLDVRKRYVRGVLAPPVGVVPLEKLPEASWPVAPSAEHEAIDAHLPSLRRAHERLAAAVDRGTVTGVSASVVWRTRVQQDDDGEVAADLGVGVRTWQRRRQRAERQLAAAS
ncbi:MAG: hypothetical protein ACREEO_02290 [Phenylobacterium sp.]